MPRALGLEYQDEGSGDAIVLIHGSILADSNAPLARALAASGGLRVISYHRRGLGRSDRHAGPFSIADQARDTAGLLSHLGIEQAHVLGHSYGGLVALQLAMQESRMVRSLILIEPPLGVVINPLVATAMEAAIGRHVTRYREGDSAAAIDGFMRGVEGPDWKAITEAAIPGSVGQAEADAPAFFEVENAALFAWTVPADGWTAITQPVGYIIGGDDRLERLRATRQSFAALVPQTQECIVPGASHGMTSLKPLETAAAVTAFLASANTG